MRGIRAAALVGLVGLFAACGGASATPTKTASGGAVKREAKTDAEKDNVDLDDGLKAPKPGMTARGEPGSGTKLSTLDEAEEQLEEDLQLFTEATGNPSELSDGSAACRRMCSSIESMRRTVEQLCELAPNAQDERCVKARTKLEESEKQVKSTSCGC